MKLLFTAISFLFSFSANASETNADLQILDLTSSWVGITALIIFGLAYVVVILEEKIHIRKSKPVLLAAGLIWVIIGIAYSSAGIEHSVEVNIRHNFLEYSELFFFLLVAMTYIDAMLERGVFDELRDKLVAKGYSYKSLFWITGLLAFFISPVADNLTTALIMCAVVMTVGKDEPKFIALACINIVVAANAGGAFSPFGDITTLMVWQKGILGFSDFFVLFIPSLVNFLVPAFIMQFALPAGQPSAPTSAPTSANTVSLKKGGLVITALFLTTIITAVCVHTFLHIPPVFGMMLGLAYLKLYGFYLRRTAAVQNKFS
ncbi:MAG: Na+/H+ antiporter NhaD/arsenite permease-like protein, partial [Bermanella sp.]